MYICCKFHIYFMSDSIKHECGIALIRLLKPQNYYKEKYNDLHYGLSKLYLLMEKQHNRGQEAAGLACIKIDAAPAEEYIFRERHLGTNAITECFDAVNKAIGEQSRISPRNIPYMGEIYLGHLRYSTTGHSGISYVEGKTAPLTTHKSLRSGWPSTLRHTR